ncbi:MAG: hypothetical protein LBP76_14620 [Treponema sp.]|jgi:hypothetical protein|nr:hypothetical protein [Treponema sp.]
MSGMYPNNQTIEIFGEEVQWPGVDGNGKCTNGSFSDPMVKPSFIPAQTINLILDNLEGLIKKCNEAPNATTVQQLAGLITNLAQANKIMQRDAQGRAKVAAPVAHDDIARLQEILDSAAGITSAGYGLYSTVLTVLRILIICIRLSGNRNPAWTGRNRFNATKQTPYGILLIPGASCWPGKACNRDLWNSRCMNAEKSGI